MQKHWCHAAVVSKKAKLVVKSKPGIDIPALGEPSFGDDGLKSNLEPRTPFLTLERTKASQKDALAYPVPLKSKLSFLTSTSLVD